MTESEEKYGDILNLPHHQSKVHPQMSIYDRAAQFSPFAALTGHEAAIKETARLTEEQVEQILDKYSVGKVVTGKVARMTNFGAFIELDTGVDALLHVSQIAREHIEKPSDVLNIGDEITAMVVDFKEESKKISLSIKQLLIAEEKNKEDAEEVSE